MEMEIQMESIRKRNYNVYEMDIDVYQFPLNFPHEMCKCTRISPKLEISCRRRRDHLGSSVVHPQRYLDGIFPIF